MSFRVRQTLLTTTAVALAVLLAAFVAYLLIRDDLRGQVDRTLRAQAHDAVLLARSGSAAPGLRPVRPATGRPRLPPQSGRLSTLTASDGPLGSYLQYVRADGHSRRLTGQRFRLPTDARVRAVAAGRSGPILFDTRAAGQHLRVIVAPVRRGLAVELARPLTEVDRESHQLALIFAGVGLAGIALAAPLGGLVARIALAPIRRLTAACEHVAATQNLDSTIDATGIDELGRLAGSFNAMLAALARSRQAQRQLVGDASHELRTPIASARTNLEALAQLASLPAEARTRIGASAAQLGELSVLVSDLVELARNGETAPRATEQIRLDLLAADTLKRASAHAPGIDFQAELKPCLIEGDEARLARAVANLLDNAVKWSPTGAPIEVSVEDGEVSVRDHGPGIADDELPLVFERFYRAAAARGLPGSGLGLAIVKQVAEEHGGSISVEHADGGGTRMRLKL